MSPTPVLVSRTRQNKCGVPRMVRTVHSVSTRFSSNQYSVDVDSVRSTKTYQWGRVKMMRDRHLPYRPHVPMVHFHPLPSSLSVLFSSVSTRFPRNFTTSMLTTDRVPHPSCDSARDPVKCGRIVALGGMASCRRLVALRVSWVVAPHRWRRIRGTW